MPGTRPQQYVALLRGINVGGRRVSMPRLCECFRAIKLSNVRSFIASGNVLFECGERDPASIEQRLETAIAKQLGFESATFLRTPAELRKVTAINPFATETNVTFRQHIVFVRSKLTKAQSAAVAALSNDYDELEPKGREVFWLCRGSFHESKVKQAALTKAIGGPWTARNVQTVTKLAAMFHP